MHSADPDPALGDSAAPDLTRADPQVAEHFGERGQDVGEDDVGEEGRVGRGRNDDPA